MTKQIRMTKTRNASEPRRKPFCHSCFVIPSSLDIRHSSLSSRMVAIPAPDFDLEMTLNSGQVFHWEKAGAGFVGTIDQYAVYAEQDDNLLKVRFGGTPKPTRETRVLPGMIVHYFAL